MIYVCVEYKKLEKLVDYAFLIAKQKLKRVDLSAP